MSIIVAVKIEAEYSRIQVNYEALGSRNLLIV
jgi:hypothetical protein